MAATVGRVRLWSVSIDSSAWRALVASWLGWMFDGYETYALILVMGVAARDLLPPAALRQVSVYMGGLLAATLMGMGCGWCHSRCACRLYWPQAHAHDLDPVVRRFCRADRALLGLLVRSDFSLLYRARVRRRMGAGDSDRG